MVLLCRESKKKPNKLRGQKREWSLLVHRTEKLTIQITKKVVYKNVIIFKCVNGKNLQFKWCRHFSAPRATMNRYWDFHHNYRM